MPLLHFVVSLVVYVGGGCALVYYATGEWWEMYAIVAWFGFWMSGLRGMILMLWDAMESLSEGLSKAAETYLAEDED